MADSGVQIQGGNVKVHWNDLQQTIDAIMSANYRNEPVILIGHSRGAAMILEAANKLPYDIHVDLLITLGLVDLWNHLQTPIPRIPDTRTWTHPVDGCGKLLSIAPSWDDIWITPAPNGSYTKPSTVGWMINLYSEFRTDPPGKWEVTHVDGATNTMIPRVGHGEIDNNPLAWSISQTAMRLTTVRR